jgi:Spy/CpxP family protein refolding chaperone
MLAKTRIAGLMMTLMAVSAPLVWADNGVVPDSSHQAGDWHHGQHDPMRMMAKVLNLSDDQVKQLKDSHQKQKEAMKSVFEQMKSNREAFDAEISKATPDMGKIADIQIQIKTLQSQMVDNHLNSLLEVKKILTPEQFAGYMALTKERRMMKRHMMGHGKFGHKDGIGGPTGPSGMQPKDDGDHGPDSQE